MMTLNNIVIQLAVYASQGTSKIRVPVDPLCLDAPAYLQRLIEMPNKQSTPFQSYGSRG